jgi:hypothetical protein
MFEINFASENSKSLIELLRILRKKYTIVFVLDGFNAVKDN